VWSTLLQLRQTHRRQKHLASAIEQLGHLKRRLAAARARLRGAAQIDFEVAQILERYHVVRYLRIKRVVREQHSFQAVAPRAPRPQHDLSQDHPPPLRHRMVTGPRSDCLRPEK
jgi:hypothetical protein